MKKLLIVVDYQIDFIDPNGKLYVKDGEKIYPSVLRVVDEYRANKDDIIFLKDTHYEDYLKTEEGKNLPLPHTIKGTKGHELYGELEDISKDYLVIEKETFGSDKLGLYLQDNYYDEITLIGVLTNMCVIANCFVAKSFSPNSHFRIIKDAVSSGDKIADENALNALRITHFEIV